MESIIVRRVAHYGKIDNDGGLPGGAGITAPGAFGNQSLQLLKYLRHGVLHGHQFRPVHDDCIDRTRGNNCGGSPRVVQEADLTNYITRAHLSDDSPTIEDISSPAFDHQQFVGCSALLHDRGSLRNLNLVGMLGNGFSLALGQLGKERNGFESCYIHLIDLMLGGQGENTLETGRALSRCSIHERELRQDCPPRADSSPPTIAWGSFGAAMAETMLEKYGRGRLARIVSSFYSDVLRSRRLAPYFADASIAGLIEHQSQFLAMVMGGPPAQTEIELEVAHQRLGITADDFDEMLRLLENTLGSFGVDPADVAQVMSRYRQMQGSVVNPSPRGVSDPAS